MVAGATADAGWAITAWMRGALVSLAGALCYAELATAYRHAGGDYHFLTRAYGRDASFLYAWARATVINTGAIALLAFVFGDYVSTIFPLGNGSGAIWAAVIVTLADGGEHRRACGHRHAPRIGSRVIEVAGLAAVVVAGIAASPALAPAASATGGAFSTHALGRRVRPRDGVRAADLRRLERSGVPLGRGARRQASDHAGAARRASRSSPSPISP